MGFDFSGWVTRNNIRCSDGRVISQDAFAHCDNMAVPLIWNHQHSSVDNVLGSIILENREDGVYGYGTFNHTDSGRMAKELVRHGDVDALSIYANGLEQSGSSVTYGNIREVSLVVSGANPGAYIDYVDMAHSESGLGNSEAWISFIGYDDLVIAHSDEGDDNMSRSIMDRYDELDEETQELVNDIVDYATSDDDDDDAYYEEEYEEEYDDDEPVYDDDEDDDFDPEYEEEYDDEDDEDYEDEYEEEDGMRHNAFDYDDYEEDNYLSHGDVEAIFNDAKSCGSLKESFLAHAADYGIDGIEWLFPEVHNLNPTPEFIKRDTNWVDKVFGGAHKTPFSKVKSVFADITEDEARAKGYIKGNYKKEEVFTLLKRQTGPTTIYKKQKMDRDDMVDLGNFAIVSWLKTEMRMMLNEEIARAMLLGDGRNPSSDDKIKEDCIRPIWKDEDLFTVKAEIAVTAADTAAQKTKKIIDGIIKSRKNYKGTGSPTFFTTEDFVTECLLLEDGIGHKLYKSVNDICTALRVKEIVTVEVMEGLSRMVDSKKLDLVGIYVNMADYNLGADQGGAINMFDDFDIDYNQQKYLIETRCSGALVKPFSAVAVETTVSAS